METLKNEYYNMQGGFFVLICDKWRHCFKVSKITLQVKNIPTIMIITTDGLVHYFFCLTLFQSHNLVMEIKLVLDT